MKKSSRIKQILSVALVSVLAATVMPSTASANGEYEYDDNVVTVEVELSDGGGDTGCVGISTLELPDSTLRARFDGLELGTEDPDVIDYLTWWNEPDGELTNADLEGYLGTLGFRTLTYTVTTTDDDPPTVDNLTSISYSQDLGFFLDEDRNRDRVIDGTDSPDYLPENRRTYVSNPFVIGFDANDCMASEDIGLLLAARGYVKRSVDNGYTWATADVDRDFDGVYGSTSFVNRGEAHLISPVSIFNNSLPRKSARNVGVFGDGEVGGGYDLEDWSPIAFGDEGQPEMRAALQIFGSNPTGKYQTKFYFVLEVGDEEYFDGLEWFDYDYFLDSQG
jgi:hypothetical protein